MHEAVDEMFAALDEVPVAEESRPRAKRDRRPPTLVRPPGEPRLPTTAARADKILRQRGLL
jgi:hypothetical protein